MRRAQSSGGCGWRAGARSGGSHAALADELAAHLEALDSGGSERRLRPCDLGPVVALELAELGGERAARRCSATSARRGRAPAAPWTGVRCWSVRTCSTRVRGGERCRKSIDTAAAFARPRKVIGAPAVMSASSAVCARSVAAWCWRCAAASRFSAFAQSIPGGTSGARATRVGLLSSLDPLVPRGSTQTGCSARNRGAPRQDARSGAAHERPRHGLARRSK